MTQHVSQSENPAKQTQEVFEACFTCAEACKILNLSRPTVMKLVREGKLPAFKPGGSWRFKPADVRAFMERNSSAVAAAAGEGAAR